MNDLKYCVPEWALPCMPCLEDEEAREKRKINQKIDQQIKKEKVRHRRQVCFYDIQRLENSQKIKLRYFAKFFTDQNKKPVLEAVYHGLSFETHFWCHISKLEMTHCDWLKFFRIIYSIFFSSKMLKQFGSYL